jgi:hypothetical protein
MKPEGNLTYLAAPYIHANPRVIELRMKAVDEAAVHFIRQGHVIFSPLTHSHPLAIQFGLPGTWEFWEKQDRVFISRCNALIILQLPRLGNLQGCHGRA